MQPEYLTIEVLYSEGNKRLEILEILESFLQLKVLGWSCDPQEFISRVQNLAPDLILVYLGGDIVVPDWLEALHYQAPVQSQILACTSTRNPDFLIQLTQSGIKEILPLPLQRQDVKAALARMVDDRKRLIQSGASRPSGSVVIITGIKGGVGCTTLVVNLSQALSNLTTERIALVDLSRPFPDIAHFLDLEVPYTIMDLVNNLASLDQDFIQKIMQPYGDNLAVLSGWPDIKGLDNIAPGTLEKIFETLRSLYRWIIVDLNCDPDTLFYQTLKEADLMLILTQMSVPGLRNLKKIWSILEEWQGSHKSRLKIVVNRYMKGGGMDLKSLEQITRQPVFFTLPNDYQTVIESVNLGTPFVKTAPDSPLSRSLQQLAKKVTEEMGGGSKVEVAAARRWFRIFSRGKGK